MTHRTNAHRATSVLMRGAYILLGCLLATALPESSFAESSLADFSGKQSCRWYSERHTAPEGDQRSDDKRQYSPDRRVDVEHVLIDVTPNFKTRTIRGQMTITFKPIAKPLKALELHATDLSIHEVTASQKVAAYDVTTNHLKIIFAKPVPVGQSCTAVVRYEAEPNRGMYFRTPQMGYKTQDTHLWTQGEPHDSRFWFPCFDYPNERFTSEVICRVPPEMIAVSNGKRVSEKLDKKTSLKAYHWLQEKPHVSYLIALVAGKFRKLEAKHGDISLGFYTPPSQFAQAENSFRDTMDMMTFFEKETGQPYPWAKYDQVVVDDFNWGGMENTTLTILNDRTLFTQASENIRSSQTLVAHELIHQWFGDYVTCRDWSHVWLNEGFATYFAHLYDGHKNGHDAYLYGLYRDSRRIIANKNEKRPMIYREYVSAKEQFDQRAYQKGSWVLHMLRTQLGPKLFRQCVAHYLKENGLRSVVTGDLIRACQQQTGLSLQRFFDQWVYHARHPELDVSYAWDESSGLARVSVKQIQKNGDTDKVVGVFAFPVKLRFKTSKGTIDKNVTITKAQHDFHIKLPAKPNIVRFDADFGLLGDVRFKKPDAMLYAQLKDTDDVIGRLLAIEALKDKKSIKTIGHLKEVLNSDPFHGVRTEASAALRQIHTQDAFSALADSIQQDDARVRKQVVGDIAAWFEPRSAELLIGILDREKNPQIQAAAIQGLGLYHGKPTTERLIALLGSKSYRNILVGASVGAMRSLDEPLFVQPLLDTLAKREIDLTSRDFAWTLKTLAFLARHQKNRDQVRMFLLKRVDHPKQRIAVAAIEALGTLGDPKAVAVIESFNVGSDQSRMKRAAASALEAIRSSKKPSAELKDLRKEVMDLKKANQTMQDDLKKLQDQFKAKNGK
jgi:aminopeptidase N